MKGDVRSAPQIFGNGMWRCSEFSSGVNRAGRCNHVLPRSDKLGEAGELANVVMFMLTPAA